MNNARTSAFAGMARRRAPVRAQRGVVVFIALIVLVAMMLAGIAVMRSSGSAILTAGNLAFRQNATVAGDRGLEAARNWLVTQGTVPLAGTIAASGYCETWEPGFRPLNQATWTQCPSGSTPGTALTLQTAGPDAAGNTVTYVIHRMCQKTGAVDAVGQECVTVSDPGKGGPKEAGAKALTGTSQVYYRVTARIDGPKNTVSYVQTMVY
jgi:type IV pilus assembly protein PilX